MNRFFTLLLAASCLTAVGQECAGDIYPPIFTGELAIPEGVDEDSYEINEITLTYAFVDLFLSSETINFLDIENPEMFMPIYEDNCTDSLDLNWQQCSMSGGCVGVTCRQYFFSDSNGNQTDIFEVFVTLHDNESPYIIQGPSDLTLDCSNSLYYQEALDWFESGGGILAGDSVATFLEGSVFEYDGLDVSAQYDLSAFLAGEPATIEVGWRVADQCGNVGSATSLLILECGSNVEGCMDEIACNYNPSATEEDASCLYLDDCFVCGGDNSSCMGCLDSQACNYNDTIGIISHPESCDYSCCPGPGCCLDGQHWDWDLNGCVITNPSDSNFDGCVQLNDLLDLLSAYGDCGAEESPWQCGDPLEYQGYDYETVQIGEQCWFAENSRYFPEIFPFSFSPNCNDALAYVTGYDGYDENAASEFVQGGSNVLYNAFAVADWNLCPSGWHVTTDGDWVELEVAIGMSSTEANSTGYRGTDEAVKLASTNWFGTDEFGFTMMSSAWRDLNGGEYGENGVGAAHFWTSTPSDEGSSWYRYISAQSGVQGQILRFPSANNAHGYSVRCIKD